MFNTTFIFSPTLENYIQVLLNTDYFKCFLDNIIVSGGAVIISILVGVPGAYVLARFDFKGKEDLAFTILSFKFAPAILVILPLFAVYQKLGLYDTYFGLIWVYQLISLPLLIWVLRGYFEDISIEIEQAAYLDGYSGLQVFWKILLPLIKPGLVASGLLAFIFAWNSFTFSLLLSGFNIQTVTVASLRYLASDTVHYGQMAVASVVAALPEIILALLIQKHLVRGLSFGAVKG
jgi:multiple sugar transport system permease protein